MKHKIFLFLIGGFLLSSCEIFQPQSPKPEAVFIKFFGNAGEQEGISIKVLNDEVTYVLGHIEQANAKQLYLIQMDNAGNENWAIAINGEVSRAVDLELTENRENLLLLSQTETTNGSKIRLTKTDLNGAVIWDKTLNSSNQMSYQAARISTITGSTNILVTGTQTALSGTEVINQIYVTEIEENGNLAWEKSYNFTDRKAEFGVDAIAYNGNVVVLGRSIGLNNIERPILIEAKRTSIGEELQSEILFENNFALPNTLTVQEMLLTNNDEFFLLCNDATSTAILKTTVSSEVRITPTLPIFLNFNMLPFSFSQTQNNDLLITGISASKVGLMRVNSQGVNVWNNLQTFGIDNLNNVGHQVTEKADGSILTVGTINFSDKKMISVIKTTSTGELK